MVILLLNSMSLSQPLPSLNEISGQLGLTSRNNDLYLYEQHVNEEQDSSIELLFAIKPSQLNTFFIGAKSEFSNYDLEDASGLKDDDYSIFLKYSRAFQIN